MTRNGSAYALPTPEPRTAATASSSSPSGPAQPQGSRLLPTPVAGNFNDGASLPTWQARRDRQKKLGRNGNGIGTPLPIAIALLPTPMASDFGADKSAGRARPSGAKRQTGLPDVIIHRLAGQDCPAGTGEPARAGCCRPRTPAARRTATAGAEAGPATGTRAATGLDVAATALTAPAPRAGASPVAWGEYEPAIRRWEHVLGHPAPPPAEPGPSGRPRLSAAFAEWMMGLAPGFVTGVPGIPRTRQLKIIGNGVVPQQAALALRLLISAAAIPAAARRRHAGRRMNRPVPGPSAPHGRAPCPRGPTPALASRRPVWPPQPHGPPRAPLRPVPSRRCRPARSGGSGGGHLTVPPRGLPRAAAPPPHPA